MRLPSFPPWPRPPLDEPAPGTRAALGEAEIADPAQLPADQVDTPALHDRPPPSSNAR